MTIPERWKHLSQLLLPTAGNPDCSYKEADVIAMLRYIGAPKDLKGLISVAKSLKEVLAVLDLLLEERSRFYSELWRQICHEDRKSVV